MDSAPVGPVCYLRLAPLFPGAADLALVLGILPDSRSHRVLRALAVRPVPSCLALTLQRPGPSRATSARSRSTSSSVHLRNTIPPSSQAILPKSSQRKMGGEQFREKSGVGGPYGTGGLAAVWGEARFCLPIGGGAPVMLRGSCSALGSDDSSKLCREHGAVNLSCAIRVLWRVCLWVWRGCVPRCWARSGPPATPQPGRSAACPEAADRPP